MPIMLIGAFAVVINNFPVQPYQTFMHTVFGPNWKNFGAIIWTCTIQIASLIVVFCISSTLTEWNNAHTKRGVPVTIASLVSVTCFIAFSLPLNDLSVLPISMTGTTGLFVAILSAIATSELFRFVYLFSSREHIFSDDPSHAVTEAFAAILPTISVVGIAAVCRSALVVAGITDGLPFIIQTNLSKLFNQTHGEVSAGLLFNFFTHLLWLFGIHGNNVLDDIAQSLLTPATQANAAAIAAGLAPTHLVTKTMNDVFVFIGGSGGTLSLIIAIVLFADKNRSKTLVRYSLPVGIFNINEPLIFGAPIVLNPLNAIPFILTPLVNYFITIAAIKVHFIPYISTEVSWITPVFVSGYLATGSISGIILQVINLAVGTCIYAPFVKLAAKIKLMSFNDAYKKLIATITTEYTPESRKLIDRRDDMGVIARMLAQHLQDCDFSHEMFLMYQPIIDCTTQEIHSAEALLRWNHPQFGLVHPMLIAALAEEVDVIDKLGIWIVEKAITDRVAWTKAGIGSFHVSVNVSSVQLEKSSFSKQVLSLLEKYHLNSNELQLEITETVALIESNTTRNNLEQIHKAGITLAMDDFGVGHSSLLYLRSNQIDTLKLDGALSREIVNSRTNFDIITMIVDLCKQLHVEMIVEYVESDEQLSLLKKTGAHLIQGFYFSKPLITQDFVSYCKTLAA
jgi:lactose/cellobiose-specific phosphotransferase system IIC component